MAIKQAVIKISTKQGRYGLEEINGLTEGDIVRGQYNPKNKSISFDWNGQPAMVFIGENAEFAPRKEYDPWRFEWNGYKIYVTVVACAPDTTDIIDEYANVQEARRDMKERGIERYDLWYCAAEETDENDLNPASWGKTRKEAVDKLKATL